VFRMLCRITLSSDAHRTESVTAMDHEQTMGVNSKVLDQKQQNISCRHAKQKTVYSKNCIIFINVESADFAEFNKCNWYTITQSV